MKYIKKVKEVLPEGKKRCKVCEEIKSFEDFHNNRRRKDGRHHHCKVCRNTNPKKVEYRRLIQEKKKLATIKRKEEKLANRDEVYELEKRRAQNRLYQKRRKQNPLNRLSHNIRNSVGRYIGGIKNDSTQNILGMTFKDFKSYIGTYTSDDHLDHIVPLSWAVSEEEIYLLNHYSNLQVLTSKENIEKSNRFVRKENADIVLSLHPEWEKIKIILDRNEDKIVE